MSGQPLTIALTDDDLDDQEIFAEALQHVAPDVQLLSFSDGEHLMKFLKQAPVKLPDLIFLDLNMPIKNGKTCLSEIRKNRRIKSLPIAIYSTSSSPGHIQEAKDLGANWYISKPSTFAGVKKVLHKMIEMLKHSDPQRPCGDEFFINL